MPQTKEEKAAYHKEWYQKNKERIAAKKKEYYENHKEEFLVKKKEYYENHKEEIAVYNKEYREKNKEKIAAKDKERQQTPDGIKKHTLNNWKRRGLICEDVDSLYCHYLNATNCDECGVEFGKIGDGSGTYRCMDHSHDSGKFRNFLCHRCNLKRGEHNL